jgi:hypothetical protein
MKRTNVYLEDEQLELLRGLGRSRGEPVAALIRVAIDSWLGAQGARRIPRDEWEHRFDELMRRRDRVAKERGFTEAEVEQDVMEAIREVRKAHAARRR